MSSLLDEKLKDVLIEDVAEEYLEIREEYYECLKVIIMITCICSSRPSPSHVHYAVGYF